MKTDQTRARGQSLDQRRAEDAWKRAEIANHRNAAWDDYAREAHKLPVRIMASGLGQALAFLNAKRTKKPGLQLLLDDLSDWVLSRAVAVNMLDTMPDGPNLLKAITESDTRFMRWATEETLAYLEWINRFAEGLGRDLDTDEND